MLIEKPFMNMCIRITKRRLPNKLKESDSRHKTGSAHLYKLFSLITVGLKVLLQAPYISAAILQAVFYLFPIVSRII